MADPIPPSTGQTPPLVSQTDVDVRRSDTTTAASPGVTVVYVPDATTTSLFTQTTSPLPKQPLNLIVPASTALSDAGGPLREILSLPPTSFAKPLLPGAPNALSDAQADLGIARQRQTWLDTNAGKNDTDLSHLRGPATIGTVLAGAAMATGVGIDLSHGTLFEPPSTARPGVKLTGSPSLEGGSISISGRF